DAGALDVDALVIGGGGDVGGQELGAGAEFERNAEAGDAAGFVERDGGVDVGGGVRLRGAEIVELAGDDEFRSRALELSMGDVDFVLLHGERQLYVDVHG